MFGALHCLCATASLLAPLAFAAAGLASDSPSTVIVSSNNSDARMTRALVLIRGELSALGLEVQVRPTEATDAASSDSTSDRLTLETKEGRIVVRVFTSKADAPLVESVDLDGPGVSAEVIAVRAVEALRAARLLPSQPQRDAAPTPPVEHPPAKQAPIEERPPAEHPSETPLAPPVPLLQLALGATFVQNSQGVPQPSAHVAIRVGPHWGFIALGAESSFAGLAFERTAGSAQISRRALFLQLGARIRVHPAWELNARGGFSYLHYAAKGAAEAGYLARDLVHDTGAASLSLGTAYYFARAFGVYLDVSGLVAFDAARVRLANEDVVTLDGPSLALGGGLILGAF